MIRSDCLYDEINSSPRTYLKSSLLQTATVPKAEPYAFLQLEQWQFPIPEIGPSTTKATPPQRQLPLIMVTLDSGSGYTFLGLFATGFTGL